MLERMNRQLRREQAKQDKKAAKDKQKRRAARRARVNNLRRSRAPAPRSGAQTRADRPAPGKPLTPEQRKKMPGRFSGILMMASVFFIVLQAAVPAQQASTLTSITGAGFFLLFGYFSVLYLERRGGGRALLMTFLSGALLIAGMTVARLVRPELGMDWLMMGLSVPGVVAGAYLGRLVFYSSPA